MDYGVFTLADTDKMGLQPNCTCVGVRVCVLCQCRAAWTLHYSDKAWTDWLAWYYVMFSRYNFSCTCTYTLALNQSRSRWSSVWAIEIFIVLSISLISGKDQRKASPPTSVMESSHITKFSPIFLLKNIGPLFRTIMGDGPIQPVTIDTVLNNNGLNISDFRYVWTDLKHLSIVCTYLFWSESPELCLVLWWPGALWLLLLLPLLLLPLLLSDESLVSWCFLLFDLLPFVRRSGLLPITVSGDWELGLPKGHVSLQELPVGGVPVGVIAAEEEPPSWLEPSLAIVCGEPVFFLQW